MNMRKIAFVCDEPCISGGFNVIFRHAMGLARAGTMVAIVCKAPVTAQQIAWHPISAMADHPNLLWLDHNQVSAHRFDLGIATFWRTFLDLWKIKADRYAYFVQSIESRFYPLEEQVIRAAVEATYEAQVGFITEARWIRDYLHRLYGHEVGLALNGVDKSTFTEIGNAVVAREPGRLRVLVEGALEVPFKNVPASIRLAREGGADEVWLLTPSAADAVEGVDRVFSRVAQAETAKIYRSCDLVLKLSRVEGMFGPPLEMFHCGGTAVVFDVTGHDEYIVHGRNALVARCNDETAVVHYIRQIKEFPPFLDALKSNARTTAAEWPDWRASTIQFQAAMENAWSNAAIDRDALGRYSRRIRRLVEGHWRQAAPPDLEARIQAIYRSSSWRLTRPLRGLKRAMREKGFAAMVAKAGLLRFQTSLRGLWGMI
jgi:hypothetical protein